MRNIFTTGQYIPRERPYRILLMHTLMADSETASACAAGLEKLICAAVPDLVLLNGDITTGQKDAGALTECLKTLLAPVTERKLPWAVIFGDRDRIQALSGEEQLAVYRQIPGCLTVSGEKSISGCGNCIIPLYNEQNEPVFFIWCLDSHDHVEEYQKEFGSASRARLASPLYTEYYNDGIRFNQTMWYWHTSQALETDYGRKIPGVMCFHIPTPEHVLIPMNQGRTAMRGEQAEAVSCQTVNGGIFSAVFERRDVQAIFCGNSRYNCFSGFYGGIELAQTRSYHWTGGAVCLEISPEAEKKIVWYPAAQEKTETGE